MVINALWLVILVTRVMKCQALVSWEPERTLVTGVCTWVRCTVLGSSDPATMSDPTTFHSNVWWEGVTSWLPGWDVECLGLVLLTTCSLVSRSSFCAEALASQSEKSAAFYQVSSITNVVGWDFTFLHFSNLWLMGSYWLNPAICCRLRNLLPTSIAELSLTVFWYPGK